MAISYLAGSVSQAERRRLDQYQSDIVSDGPSLQCTQLIQLKTSAKRICQCCRCFEEMAVTVATVIILAAVVSLFAAFAAGLGWAQEYARQLSAAPAYARRPKRRPF